MSNTASPLPALSTRMYNYQEDTKSSLGKSESARRGLTDLFKSVGGKGIKGLNLPTIQPIKIVVPNPSLDFTKFNDKIKNLDIPDTDAIGADRIAESAQNLKAQNIEVT